MFKLKADNRQLTKNAKYSYTTTNYQSGVTAIGVDSSVSFSDDDYILLNVFGHEISEICQIDSINTTTHTLTTKVATKFAHSESTRVTVIPYNQVRFYHTATATFSATSPVTGYIDIQADSYYTIAGDSTNTSGFGWFVFYNSTTSKATQNSNAIPYAGFGENSVKSILDTFYGQLNNKELKLITDEDALSWLNEAYSRAITELNLTNQDYSVSDEIDISIVSGTKEYALEDDFSELVSIYDTGSDKKISKIDLKNVSLNDDSNSTSVKYYLRGNYIGFSPTPTSSGTYKYRYIKKREKLTSYYDNVNLPDDSYYILKDYMLFRASPKLNRGDGTTYYNIFMDAIKLMKDSSVKRDESNDSWGRDNTAFI